MKKFLVVMMALVLTFSLIGCVSPMPQVTAPPTTAPTAEPTQKPEPTEVPKTESPNVPDITAPQKSELEDLLADIYAKVEGDEEFKTWLTSYLMTVNITADNAEYYLGTKDVDFAEAIASEPRISSIAFSVCLVKMNEGADIEAAKTAIKENVNPQKWICVMVDKKNVLVENADDVIILIMAEKAQLLKEAFVSATAQ